MFCPMCGAPNDDNDQFCGNCGAALTPDAAPIAAPEKAGPESEAQVEAAEEIADAGEFGTQPEGAAELAAWPAPEPEVVPPLPPPPPYRPSSYSSKPSVPTSGMAIASLVLGIAGLTFVPLLASFLAILFGYMARKEIRQRPGELSGDGLALAGIVMGWIAVGLSVLGLLLGGAMAICGICGAFGAGGWQ